MHKKTVSYSWAIMAKFGRPQNSERAGEQKLIEVAYALKEAFFQSGVGLFVAHGLPVISPLLEGVTIHFTYMDCGGAHAIMHQL